MHTIQDLRVKQSLPLDIKINMTKQRIREWVNEFGVDGVYVSFSGGKDSTVLLTIARELYPDIKAVFVDTGLEYPEIRQFVKTWDNVDWIKPKTTFKQVIEKYGYPFISKEVSECVQVARKYLTDRMADLLGIERRTGNTDLYQELKKGNIPKYIKCAPIRVKSLFGVVEHKEKGVLTDEYSNRYDRSKYRFFLDAPFEISNKCCNVMKKAPAHNYQKQTGRAPIIATMAEESRLRTEKWLQQGCNSFNSKNPTSKPMSFWTENDVLHYIKENNIEICSVYGDIVPDYCGEQLEGQMDFCDLGLAEDNRKLKTTGCDRTGCMFCGFGCHLNNDQRFVSMKETHPKQYDYIMRPKEQGGLNFKEVIDWINEHGNLNIKY